ncbi:MAG: acetate--CoA ligase family protein [Chloroflexota bacterium]
MITKELLAPRSIAVIGASNDIQKPGGKILKNILDGAFGGAVYAVNPKETEVQGIQCHKSPAELPQVDLGIIAIASKFCLETVATMIKEKGTRAFIIISAGFSEMGEEGRQLEQKLAALCTENGASLIGPNCIGVITPVYNGVFAGPIPKLDPKGCDFASASGATAVFILELAMPKGITFASVFSVGNSAQIGVEEVLEHWDETFDPENSSRVKLLYLEKINNPAKLLKHSQSLIRKGCRIAAIKAGVTEAGSRAVSSHTGALAGSSAAADALLKKAGIVRCESREELALAAGVMLHKELEGKRLAIITHAGGPGVMLTDALSRCGIDTPHIEGPAAEELLGQLFYGSSVANPIDFIATGTAEQLGIILDYVDNKFENIDGSAVIFGSTGLFDVTPVYKVLSEKMESCRKPIFAIQPSIIQSGDAINSFLSWGKITFPEEVAFGEALARVHNAPKPEATDSAVYAKIDVARIRKAIDSAPKGYLPPETIGEMLDAAGIPRAKEATVRSLEELEARAGEMGFPLVMKVVGPVHKTDVGGVRLGIKSIDEAKKVFGELMQIKDAVGVLLQQMLSGTELFVGAKAEPGYGHIVLFGLGGIFIEVLKDVSADLVPISGKEAQRMIESIRSKALLEGVRGQSGIDKGKIADIIMRLSALLEAAPEIAELDLNPLLGNSEYVTAVDARIRIE